MRARALVQGQRGMCALAASELSCCLAMLLRIYGEGATVREIADVLNDLAGSLHRCGDTSGALAHYFDSLSMQTQLHGGGDNIHTDLVAVMHRIGRLYFDRAELDLALHFLSKSWHMMLLLHGVNSEHPEIAQLSREIAEVSEQTSLSERLVK